MGKKSILLIHPFLPYPLESGGHQALFNGIKAIKDDYNVTLVFQGEDTYEMRKAMEEFKLLMPDVTLLPSLQNPPTPSLSVPKTTKGWILQKMRGACYDCIKIINKHLYRESEANSIQHPVAGADKERTLPDPTEYWKYTVTPDNRKWIEHIYRVSHEKHYDLIQIEMPWIIKDIYAMPKDSRVIHVHHELGFVRRELELQMHKPNAFYDVCKKYADFNEISQLNMYDAVITLSSIDQKKLIDNGVRVPIYSSFATIDASSSIQTCNGNGKRLTFIGFGTHTPNYVGITWFLGNCWMKLKGIDPEYSLDIIGKWEEDIVTEYKEKYADIHFLGFVEDLDAAIRDSIMIVPITIGSGIRIKILEAASKGVPFVSTSVGAEGIPVKDGEHCFLADEPDVFVEDIIKLQDINLRNQFVKTAHKMVADNYSIEALRKNRLEIYDTVLQ